VKVLQTKQYFPQKGFTLIELVVVVALLLITVGVAGDIILSLTKTFGKTQVSNEIEQTSNFVFLKLEKEFRSATNVIRPTLSTASDTLEFTDRNGKEVCYILQPSGLLTRSISNSASNNCVSGRNDLTSNDTATGVKVDRAGSPYSAAFKLISEDPYVVQIYLVFSSASTSTSPTFSGSVTLNNTLVARGSY